MKYNIFHTQHILIMASLPSAPMNSSERSLPSGSTPLLLDNKMISIGNNKIQLNYSKAKILDLDKANRNIKA